MRTWEDFKKDAKELNSVIKEDIEEIEEVGKRKTITIRDFFESEEEMAIYCSTKEQAKLLLEAFDKEGYRWDSKDRYTDHSYWSYCKETCYTNKHKYCNRELYEKHKYKVFEFEDVEEMSLMPDIWKYSIDELLAEIKRRTK